MQHYHRVAGAEEDNSRIAEIMFCLQKVVRAEDALTSDFEQRALMRFGTDSNFHRPFVLRIIYSVQHFYNSLIDAVDI